MGNVHTTNLGKTLLGLGLAAFSFPVHGAVKITALQMISTDSGGKIQGVGAHRFKTTNHGGQPCLYLIESDDLNGTIVNGPGPAQNGVNTTLSVGTHTYTVYAENANSYSWNNYALNLYFDNANAAQISVLAPLNSNSTQFFPPSAPNTEFTEDLQGHSVKAPNTLEYKAGATVVKVVDFRVADPLLFHRDRISPFEAKTNSKFDYIGQVTIAVSAPPQIASGGVVNAARPDGAGDRDRQRTIQSGGNVTVLPTAPGIFQFGEKRPVAQNEDSTVNTAENPAAASSFVVVYVTGAGDVDNAVATGSTAKGNPLSRHKGNVTATINGTMAEIAFAGLTPDFIGLTQLNLKIPSLPAGTYPVVVSVNGQASTAAIISVK